MTFVPPFLRRNLSLKLLALVVSLIIYYALRERELTLPSPTGGAEQNPVVVVMESADGGLRVVTGHPARESEISAILTKGLTNAVPAASR